MNGVNDSYNERQTNGLELRKSHFMFGTDQSNQDMVDLHGVNKGKAKMDLRVQSANPIARGTNI